MEAIWEVQETNTTKHPGDFSLRHFDKTKFKPEYYGDGKISYLLLENLLTDKMVSILDVKLVVTEMLSRYKKIQGNNKLHSYGNKYYLNIQGIQIVDNVIESPPRKDSDSKKRTSIYSSGSIITAIRNEFAGELDFMGEGGGEKNITGMDSPMGITVNSQSIDQVSPEANSENPFLRKGSSPFSTPKKDCLIPMIKMNTIPEDPGQRIEMDLGVRSRAGTNNSLNTLSLREGTRAHLRRKSFYTKNLVKYDNLKTQARLIRRVFQSNQNLDSLDRESLFKLKKEILELKLTFQTYQIYHDFASVIIYYNSSLKQLDVYLIDLAYMPTRMERGHEEFFDVMTKAIDLILMGEDIV